MQQNSAPELAIKRADLNDPAVVAFLEAHHADLIPTSPPESQHSLGVEELRAEGIRVWEARFADQVAAVGALAPIEPGHEELKSMRTDPGLRGRGLGRRMVAHLVADARNRGVQRISLETGSDEFFAPARALYENAGFTPCAPFGTYTADPHSAYYLLDLTSADG
ncbi:GNAT family N-acetyltransferase [Demetria terragena]|uniref:GNAT family N-acetyltransferase n=1 Tax=Demetria terragena TaxID=63959 RepID=UPI000373C720|nr:GNAT family N-acetyltransferase [Demetria terragena]